VSCNEVSRLWPGTAFQHRGLALFFCLLSLCTWLGRPAFAQYVLPTQSLLSLRVELHSLRDQVTLYQGNPQYLLEVQTHPEGVYPNIQLSPGLRATLRIRDRALLEVPAPFDSALVAEGLYPAEPTISIPEAERWEIKIYPPVATDYLLRCERGSGLFDFTDLPVKELQVIGVDAKLQVEFRRANRVPLERCRLIADGGSLKLVEFLNAHPQVVSLQVAGAQCEVEITGKRFEGHGEVYFEGSPEELQLTISKDIGLRVEGGAAILERFAAKHMRRQGEMMESEGFADQPCRITLHFAETAAKLKVSWD
jgi:hypothetical protein